VVTYDVTVAIQQEPRYALKPDMTASVTIETGQRHNVILVPSVAVQVGVRGSTVNVITQNNGQPVVKSTPVRTGGSDGINTEITSGLTEGQTIVVAGAAPSKGGGGGAARSSSPFSPPSRGGGGGRGG
jgi:multidrug efflux pump subunit AcrA (membrane-fusion protein)